MGLRLCQPSPNQALHLTLIPLRFIRANELGRYVPCREPWIMSELVTIVGASYFEPISKLFEELERHYKGREGEIQAGSFVNGYAASICLLSVVCLESYTMRARYIHGATGDELNRLPVTKYLIKIYEDYPYLDETNEVFVVRDLLAHNHLLKVSYDTNETVGKKKKELVRISTGDKKFSANVCSETEKTNILGLKYKPNLNRIPR
jgi:hypothetical protein